MPPRSPPGKTRWGALAKESSLCPGAFRAWTATSRASCTRCSAGAYWTSSRGVWAGIYQDRTADSSQKRSAAMPRTGSTRRRSGQTRFSRCAAPSLARWCALNMQRRRPSRRSTASTNSAATWQSCASDGGLSSAPRSRRRATAWRASTNSWKTTSRSAIPRKRLEKPRHRRHGARLGHPARMGRSEPGDS